MSQLRHLLLIGLSLTVLGGCHFNIVNAFDITDVSLVTGSSANPDLVECNTLVGSDLYIYENAPRQPDGGDWSEPGSDYYRELIRAGDHAYRCATARVVIRRNPAVSPGEVWNTGDPVYLRVVAPHFCGNLHPGEDALQPLAYQERATFDGQTEFVFESVIVASECGVGPYAEEYGETHVVHLGQWPNAAAGTPLVGWSSTNKLDCTLVAGFQLNFSTCQAP